MTVARRDNGATVRKLFATYAAGDLEAWLALWHPDAEWAPATAAAVEGAVFRGKEELRRYWGEARETWQAHRVVPETVEVVGDRVLMLGRAHARGHGSGVAVERPAAYVFTVRDGLIREGRSYGTGEDAREALDAST